MFVPGPSVRRALSGEPPPETPASEQPPPPSERSDSAPAEQPDARAAPALTPSPRTGPGLAEVPTSLPAESAPAGLVAELRALRQGQERILQVLEDLRSSLGPTAAAPRPATADSAEATVGEGLVAFPPEPVRSRRRKKVLLIDDDPASTEVAVKALKKAEIPVRTASDAQAALAAIAEDKPDVIALEPNLGGATGGKDVIRTIKANVEWANIPVVLYTGSLSSLEEVRTLHGGDEFVFKGLRGGEALVSQVITLFRKR